MRGGLVLGLLVLAGCADEREPAPEPTATAAVVPAATPPAVATAGSAASAPIVALDGEGLRLVAQSGATRLLAFGIPRAQAEAAVARSVKQPAERSALGECGAGPMEFTAYGSLKLNFLDQKFVGWLLDGETNLSTMDGLSVGNTRAEMAGTRVVTPIPDSTLGDEFALGQPSEATIFGFSEGTDADGRVTMLYAGVNCFFR